MATNTNKHLAYRYGYCVNEKCEKSQKDTKGKYEIQQIQSHKPLICPECGKPLHECPPPKTSTFPVKTVGIIAAVLLLLCALGFGLYKLFGGPKGPTGIKLDKKELVMKVGETQVIVPTAEPEGVKATFIFKKKGKNVEVTSGGEITALKKGEATILVKCEENPNIRAICKVTVKEGETLPPPPEQLVKQLSIDGGDFSIKVGDSKQLTFVVVPEKHDELLSWTSDNEAVATVDNTGKVSAIKKGTATIKVAADKSGTNATVKVTVTEKPVPDGGEDDGGKKTYVTNANIGYGTYTGDVKPGTTTPHGHGTITYKTKRKVVSWKDIEAQPGDKYEGDFRDGVINGGGYLKTRDGNIIRIE